MSGDHHFYSLGSATPDGYQAYGAAFYVWNSGGPGRTPLYRFVNVTSGGHYYSINPAVPAGYTAEGNEGWVMTDHSASPQSVPLFQFYNPATDSHYYQTSSKTPDGYLPLGFEFEVFDATHALGGRLPLYRYYNPSSGKHFYTALMATPPDGYVSEGMTGYVFNSPGPTLVRLYRFVQQTNGGHYYSTDPKVPPAYALEPELIYIQNQPSVLHGVVAPLCRFYNAQADDHYYSVDSHTPPGYVAEPNPGWIMLEAVKSGIMPMFHFYQPYHNDKPKHSLWHIIEGAAVGGLLGGPAGALLGGLGSETVVNAVDGVVQFTVEGPGSIIGLVAAGGALLLTGPIGALVVYATATILGNLLIKQRDLNTQERLALFTVFGPTLSPDHIKITNLLGPTGRPFTLPDMGGQIIVNLGPGYDDPLNYKRPAPKFNDVPGQVFFHELTHAWQIQHSSFIPGLVCKEAKEQIENSLGHDVYKLNPSDAKKLWDSLGEEQQAMVVETWFADGCKLTSNWYPLMLTVTGGAKPLAAK